MGKIVGIIYPEDKSFCICPECGKEYKTQAALEKHIADKHSEVTDNE